MWEVKRIAGLRLPKGFSLFEDEDFLYLYFGDTRIGTYSSRNVSILNLESDAEDYLLKLSFIKEREEEKS